MRDPAGGAPAAPRSVAYVMPLPSDPRINRRVRAGRELGWEQTVFSFDRDTVGRAVEGTRLVRLGFVRHGHYGRRAGPLAGALRVLLRHRRLLRGARTLYAFGLDCLVLAVLARKLLRLDAAVVYELADVRAAMLGDGAQGHALRRLERWALAHVDLAVVTTAGYRDEYLAGAQGFPAERIRVLENKLLPPVPAAAPRPAWKADRPLVIGCFGLIRFQESWDALVRLAEAHPQTVHVYVRGFPMGIRGFEDDVARCPNVEYGGAYVSPDDLASLYGRVDLNWLVYGVGNDRQRRWMLPNRFFEAIQYGVPQVVNRGGILAARVEELGVGFVVDVDDPASIAGLVEGLSPDRLGAVARRVAALPAGYGLDLGDTRRLLSELPSAGRAVAFAGAASPEGAG